MTGGLPDEHAAAQAVLLAPLHVGDRVVDVVQEDLADPRAGLGLLRAVVGEPAVVRLHARVAVLVLLRARRLGEEHEAREERRHGVGEDDLTDDAVVVELLVAQLGVPVAGAELGVLEVLVRVLVLVAPGVEVVAVLGVEELSVLRVAATGVAVGGDDDVVVVGLHGVPSSSARVRRGAIPR